MPKPQPLIPAHKSLPEITIKAFILSIVLSMVLAAANAYLGLFAGMTVSASIPAAVISMALLKLFKNSNILENNIVQTSASAGESLVAGVIFTIPALVIGGYWSNFGYWETSFIACLGGILGVLFTVPLRRALIIEQPLPFPEGVATSEVLKAGNTKGASLSHLIVAGLLGFVFKVCVSGLRLSQEAAQWATSLGSSVLYIGASLSPALLGVGYIIGFNIAVLVFLGGAINWWIAIPIITALGSYEGGAQDIVWEIWSTQTRYIGVGAMLVGGLWALVCLRKNLIQGVMSGIEAYRHASDRQIARTEKDIPMPWILSAAVVMMIPLGLLFYWFTESLGLSIFMAVFVLIAGFLFSAVAAYMAGLVGSSNNPVSGVTIATVLLSSLLLLLLLGTDNQIGPIATILIGSAVCCAAAIGGDNMQDLKTGHIVGATPYKQQIMQIVGVIAAAFSIAPILHILHSAYGIGVQVHPGQAPLKAPQAALTETVAKLSAGFEQAGLPWTMIFIGMIIAVLVIIFDRFLEKNNSTFRIPILALAVGIYLPFELSLPIVAGGMISWMANRSLKNKSTTIVAQAKQTGLLFAAGLITGEALAGIGLAIPIAATQNPHTLSLFENNSDSYLGLIGPSVPYLGLIGIFVIGKLIYKHATISNK